jgi:outer membrane lipoprotein-sorting protein
MFKHAVFSLVLMVLASSTTPVLGQGSKAAGDDRAKQLFQEMEQRLAKAKSLECSFEIKAE